MNRRNVITLILAAASLAAPAQAQFQPVVMKLPAWIGAEVAPGRWGGPGPGDDLLVLRGSGTPQTSLVYWQHLLTFEPWNSTPPVTSTLATVAAGRFDALTASSPDGSPDVVWAVGQALAVSWGAAPGAAESFPLVHPGTPRGLGTVRLLPRAAPVLVSSFGSPGNMQDQVCVADLAAARGTAPTAPSTRCLPLLVPFPSAEGGEITFDRVHPIRLSPEAVANGVDDAIIPLKFGFRLLWNATPATATSLAELGVTQLTIGSTVNADLVRDFLPPGVPGGGSCLGVAALDMDNDGDRDLVFSYSDEVAIRGATGYLLWIENTGAPGSLETTRWRDLTTRADLQPLMDPGTLRQLDLGGESVLVVHDRKLDQFLVIRGDGWAGFTVRRLPAFGASARDFEAADVVGSTAPDLIARVVTATGGHEVWVYPDDGDMATVLSWSPAPPLVALAGLDLPLGVSALDPDQPATPFAIDWYLSDPAASVATGGSWTVPAENLCGPATALPLTVRALDTYGVYTQLEVSIPIEWRPSLSLAGASPPGRLLVAPGGASGRAEGTAWPACGGSPVFTWGESGLSGIVQTGAGSTGSTAWREFNIPESAYADLLDGTAAITLRVVDTGRDGTNSLPLLVDARGVVEATVAFDRAALAQGDLGAAQIRIESWIGLPLPRVRVLVRLAGLSFAGSMRVTGAPATLGPGLGELIIDPLPAHGTAVEIVVPVRAHGTPGAVSVELFSEGGDRVSPEAAPDAGDGSLPGCGCGDGGAGPLGLLLVILGYMKPIRRVLASTRSTSSSTRITRHA